MYTIGLSRPHELSLLPAIERQASDLFLEFPFTADIPADPTPVAEFEAGHRAGLLWVARTGADEPVGFALVNDFGPHLHLEEVDVLPQHGRRGLGTRLVREVLSFELLQQLLEVTRSRTGRRVTEGGNTSAHRVKDVFIRSGRPPPSRRPRRPGVSALRSYPFRNG
jgi:hypothetical protein